MKMFKNLPEKSYPETELASMLSLVGSHAKTYPAPVRGPESEASAADYGPRLPAWLASYDQNSSSWKTAQRCLVEGWERFSETWPRSGSMLSGNAFQRQAWVPLISVTGFGYLPTPDKSCGRMFGMNSDLMTCFTKETSGVRKSGAKIGASLRWCPEFIRERQRTGGDINPVWTERLMGFPDNWTELEPAGTPWSP